RERLRRKYAQDPPLRVFYEISAKPLYTVGGGQIISQILALCGGRNIFAKLTTLAPVVDEGAVVARNPQAIFTDDSPGAAGRLDDWRRWPWLAAVKADNLFVLPADLIGRAGPRILKGAAIVCRDLSIVRSRAGKS
ncbi:MAG TPA: cobalamin-binding protein, partial [Gammaproteobacteria bacterium]|nr:cobalamin-binding protein [Gammaproteobacteria bacterium]